MVVDEMWTWVRCELDVDTDETWTWVRCGSG